MIWKEDENQDKILENGDFVLLEDQDAVIQQIGTVLRLAKNDQFTDLEEGLRWVDDERGILGASDLSLENEAEIIEKITGVFGVRQLQSLTAEFTDETSFTFSLATQTEWNRLLKLPGTTAAAIIKMSSLLSLL